MNETAPAKASAAGQLFVSTAANAIAARTPTAAYVATSETSTSNAYTALTTPGPAVTVTTGTQAIVIMTALDSNNTNAGGSLMSYAVSGATTTASSDARCIGQQSSLAGLAQRRSGVFLEPLTAGSNTFTCQYRVGASTGTWQDRRILVIPL